MRLLSLLVFFSLVLACPVAAAGEANGAPESAWKPHPGMIIGGLGGFGASYGFALWLRSTVENCESEICESGRRTLPIPFAGPIIHAVNLAGTPLPEGADLFPSVLFPERVWRWFAIGVLAADGLLQAGSVALLIAGIIHRSERKREPIAATVRPVLRPAFFGVEGSF
jgi:hypothetical protein